MAKYFTSIFHEEVISVNEECARERLLAKNKELQDSAKKKVEELNKERKANADKARERLHVDTEEGIKKLRSQKESFLPEIELI